MTTATATDRLRQRFAKWDHNGDGVLERADFVEEANAIVRAFGASPNAPQATALVEALGSLFDHHAAKAGVPSSGSITEDQFVQINEQLLYQEGEASFNRVLSPVIKALIGLSDHNADGVLDKQEFVQWLAGIGVSESDAVSAFEQIDTNGNGQLTADELLAAVRKFHYGELNVPLLG